MAKKRVLVVIRLPLDDERASQALRAAVAYAAVDLDVTVALTRGEQAAAAGKAARHLQMLRAMGHRVLSVDESTLCALLRDLTFATAIVW